MYIQTHSTSTYSSTISFICMLIIDDYFPVESTRPVSYIALLIVCKMIIKRVKENEIIVM